MRPLTAIIGILLGSCAAISISLAAVLFVFLVLGDDYPRLQHELRPLSHSMLIFLSMTIITAASFYAWVKNHRARYWALGGTCLGLAATIGYYLP